MELKELAGKAMMAAWQDEVERAIANVKRTELDRWFRRAWYKAEQAAAQAEWGPRSVEVSPRSSRCLSAMGSAARKR